MSSADLSACRNCISKLMANKHCEPFLHPVDPVRDEAPDYFDVISQPMDLTTIANKLQAGHYRDRFQFKDDVELIFRNAKTYTPDPKAWIHYEASRSETAFRQHWSRITKTLEQAAARAAAVGRPRADEEEASEPPEGHTPRVTLKIKRPAADDGDESRKRTIRISLKSDSDRHAHTDDKGAEAREKEPAPESDSGPAQETTLEPSPEPTPEPTPEPAPEPTPAPAPRKVGLKIRRPKPAQQVPAPEPEQQSVATESVPTELPAAPAPSAKPAPSQTPERPRDTSSKLAPAAPADECELPGECETPLQPKKVRAVLQSMMKQKEAVIFLRPVDPVLDGAPTYYDEIKHPMDLGTVDRKFKNGEYTMMSDFAHDIRLIFANCRQFNPPGTIPRVFEAALVKTWRREWGKAMVRKLSYQGKRALQGMLSRLKQHPTGGLFLYAVDPCVSC